MTTSQRSRNITRPQRIIFIVYCFVLVYCCIWIPWSIPYRNSPPQRVGYGWLWAGPAVVSVPSPPSGIKLDYEPPWDRARPDLELIGFRLLAVSALSAAASLLVGIRRKPCG